MPAFLARATGRSADHASGGAARPFDGTLTNAAAAVDESGQPSGERTVVLATWPK
jgi:hypothetical protein